MNDLSLFPSLAARLARPERIRLAKARVPVALLFDDVPGAEVDRDGSALVDILIEDGRFAALTPALPESGEETVALDGRHVWPLLIDAHAHLDKGHTIGRAPDSGGTHPGARAATTADRLAYWNADDLMRRMEFGLATADAHGVVAIRTHLDSHEGQADITWNAFAQARERWKGRVTLQAAGLVPLDAYRDDYGARLADIVAGHGGLLGGVTRASGGTHGSSLDDIDLLLDQLFALAKERELDVDLHVDEAAQADALPHVARATIRHGYEGRVTCGHCCSLSLLSEDELRERISLIADAGLSIITLPTVNMYLQDREAGRTPRWRGVTPMQELRAAGIPVAAAGDNCRDPFHAYGDHDMLDTWRQSVRILHLDHPYADATALAGPTPAGIMGIDAGTIGIGRSADLMILEAWSLDQVIARPHSDRVILRRGIFANRALPSYSMLADFQLA
ncbi:cytosine deaminase-like protein (plasmid) [Rhizobium etli 8C-3]|uniref:Cytosine deaminase-like protein n=1 Tax=Rhizobium etli 8C-3 TaxID=538025 RepID=A0A1L5PHZ0_RHIET|nr:cytosine deaminase [Rhizobium etli]APO79650.1 cytosine deaminase-like protein [Rhizobium etli 8C-3]